VILESLLDAHHCAEIRAEAERLIGDLLRMLGYSIHPPFMGMVDGMHPKRVLEEPPLSAPRPG
jgi:hypothetical protein